MRWKETKEAVPFDEAVPKVNKDIVVVIRCKDCKHYDYGCKLLHTTEIQGDWFCADGEKKQ